MAEDMDAAQERIRRGYEAFSRGDFDEAGGFVHPDIAWHRVIDVEQTLEGRDAVRHNMEPEAWNGQTVEIHGMEVFGDSLVVDATFRAEGAGSGIPVQQRGCHLWKIRDGLGGRFEYFTDRDEAVRAAKEQEGLA